MKGWDILGQESLFLQKVIVQQNGVNGYYNTVSVEQGKHCGRI